MAPSASPNSLNYGLQVHLWVHAISKPISKLLRSQLPSTSLSSHDHGLVNRPSSHGIRREFVRKSGSGSRSVGRGSADMKRYPAVRNRTNCVDLWKLGKSAWEQELGKINCVFRIMRWYLSTRGVSQIYTPHCLVHLRYLCTPRRSVRFRYPCISHRPALRSQLLQNLTILKVKYRSILNAPP